MEKRRKIQVFQRELPLCLELVKQPPRKDFGSDLTKLLSDCITAFKDNAQYRDDIRFLKIWFPLYDTSEDFESVFSGNVAQGDLCWPILGGNGLGCSVANSREMLQGRLALRYGKYGDEFEVV
ncbi:hypothetical protein ACFXTN_034658 [Malus domestica]